MTDLDDTLYDWLGTWTTAFETMLHYFTAQLGIYREIVIPQFRNSYRKHGSSEYLSAVSELPALSDLSKTKRQQVCADIAIAYRESVCETLRLYPTVAATLTKLRLQGYVVVGYSDSRVACIRSRAPGLGLDGLLDCVYTPPGPKLKSGSRRRPRFYRYLPPGLFKPNPVGLLTILSDFQCAPSNAIYIGDSLARDIAMARSADITSVWAKYGNAQERKEYDLLRQVSHRTESDFYHELRITPDQVTPDQVLKHKFSDLLDDLPL